MGRTELGAGVDGDLRATMFWLEFAQTLAERFGGEGSEVEPIEIKPLTLHTHAVAQCDRKSRERHLRCKVCLLQVEQEGVVLAADTRHLRGGN